jgi:6-phosphogluconolactonase/glucosamine-6-phosphate isomerase/deaminase
MGHHVIRTENFATDAADFILDEAHKALGERSEFRIALSGGNTPVPIYTRLAVIGHDLPWELARITFGDERCVPPDDRQSNFRMARETLLGPAAVPENQSCVCAVKSIHKSRHRNIRINSTFWPRSEGNRLIGMI